MLDVTIPGCTRLSLAHLVLDYNGTLASDGQLLDGVGDVLNRLADRLELHVITADTFGRARSGLDGIRCRLSIVPDSRQAEAKRDYVRRLGSNRTAAIGNGQNDRLMLREATLGIAVVEKAGAAVEAVLAADVVCCGVLDALGLLVNPKRLVATLRS